MVLDLTILDAADGTTRELLVGVVTLESALLLAKIAIGNLNTGLLKIRGRVALVFSIGWDVCLVAQASEVVSKAMPHVLDRVDLAVFHPLVVLVSWIQPEGEPVGTHVTRDLIVELHL